MRIIQNLSDVEAGLEVLVALDPRLAPLAQAAGPLPLRLSQPGFAGLASIVVSQVVSRASAEAIWRRIEACGPVTAIGYASLAPEVVASFGLSRAKASTLRVLAEAVIDESIDLDGVCALGSAEAVRQLTSLRGIGPWTAEVYLMFCAGHPDIFPVGDVALRAAVAHGLALGGRPEPRELAAMAEMWSPWRSVAARLFWAYYAAEVRREVAPMG